MNHLGAESLDHAAHHPCRLHIELAARGEHLEGQALARGPSRQLAAPVGKQQHVVAGARQPVRP